MRLFKCRELPFTDHEEAFVDSFPVIQDLQAPFAVGNPRGARQCIERLTGPQWVGGSRCNRPQLRTLGPARPPRMGTLGWLADDFPETGNLLTFCISLTVLKALTSYSGNASVGYARLQYSSGEDREFRFKRRRTMMTWIAVGVCAYMLALTAPFGS